MLAEHRGDMARAETRQREAIGSKGAPSYVGARTTSEYGDLASEHMRISQPYLFGCRSDHTCGASAARVSLLLTAM